MDDPHSVVDEVKPWEQQPGEPIIWFARFTKWLHQKAAHRSVLALCREEREKNGLPHRKSYQGHQGGAPKGWKENATAFSWRARAAAWDLAEQERKDREWADAREEERVKELAIATNLRAKADALLKLPVLTQVVKRDDSGQEVAWLLVPEFRAFTAASGMYMDAKKHARAALEMPDKYEYKSVTNTKVAVEVEAYAQLSDEERFDRIMEIARQAQTAGDS